ncbi:MAG TPA: dynamin [Cyanobacteria bacterium UBA11149]|nr:dynamin [Cyanobacteria bacterium UBA11367]HBE60912.1 dynamin [Cyanobacteria bacterium UBA11366]HBK62144.1 dynamin [Cyanobacteria bacterium UBA11166]HBR76620.1 dynamin [Cyanobacteria bacterium UBA11159]HBS72381.1 dynamin [Cyanobacteria bacterium UBA11153]HBW92088.1 dynamin [Cyanobacteria bacterium UBA11149]HCA97066.1 dynamin [Cyanobacteria bacterium UBA9226]
MSLIGDLDRFAQARYQVATHLSQIAETISKSEVEGAEASGKLGMERECEDISIASENLRKGVFRLMVLGDLKRGKSTFLNALIGENVLPSDVNPCTALLTILRYGKEKKVTVYFKEGKLPEKLDFAKFKDKYTIEANEAKQLEELKQQAFPDVDYAVVEYPLPLLEKGIEIVDSPGLNDTESRNELSLSYINNCHAILFVFRATQPCTLEEKRYLENYIKGRGLTVFFLINAWDEIKKGIIDPDNIEALTEAENTLRQVFQTNLTDYCQVDGKNIYEERVFEISSLNALRRRLKNPEDGLEGTGLTEFMTALNKFLTQEKAVAQIRQAKTIAQQTYTRLHDAIQRRIPLLKEDIEELKRRIDSVEPEFQKFQEIRDIFQNEIHGMRDKKARAIADSFRTFVLGLENTFELDFLRYQPDIGFWDFLQKGRREEFNAAFKQAFEQYLNDKIAGWELTAQREMEEGFSELSRSAASYGATYNQVAESINEKLIGQKLYATAKINSEDSSPSWASWAMGFMSLASANVAGLVLAGAGFNWQNILVNWVAVLGIWSFLSIFSITLITGPIGLMLLSVGVGAVQTDQIRKEVIKTTRKEFAKYLPQVAQEQWQPINQAVRDCFDAYEREVNKRINDDIKSRKSELENLMEQKQSREINQENELARLKQLDGDVLTESRGIESLFAYLSVNTI